MNSQIPKYHATLPQHQVQQVQAQGLGLQSHGQGHELGNRLQVQSLNNPQGQDRPQILQYDMINHFQQFGQTYPIYQTPLYKYPYQNNQQHHHQHQNQYQQQQSQRVQHQILQLPKLEPSPIIHQPSQLHHAQFHPQFYGMQQDVPISYSHYEHKSLNTKRHKKSKSFPDNKPLDHSSSSGNSKKSHYAEAPSSKDIKFPISQFSSNKFTPLTGLMLNNLYTKIEVKKYSTSAIDPLRNYLTVYEYPVNKHWVIWDYETGFVHLTGIWKASLNEQAEDNQQQLQPQQYVPKSHSKADIVKLLETTPKQYQQHIKRIRGGFLKIQGTWLPYYLCKIVARKFCYYIRYELVPIFGEDFPDSCLTPDDPGFGKLRLDESCVKPEKKKRSRSQSSSSKERPTKELTSPLMSISSTFTTPTSSSSASSLQSHTSVATTATTSTPALCATALTSTNSTALNSPADFKPLDLIPRDDPSYAYMFGRNTSYNEILDIVTASKCLQSLRSGKSLEHPFTRPSPLTSQKSEDVIETTASSSQPSLVESQRVKEDGHASQLQSISPRLKTKRRFSLKIHDLIS